MRTARLRVPQVRSARSAGLGGAHYRAIAQRTVGSFFFGAAGAHVSTAEYRRVPPSTAEYRKLSCDGATHRHGKDNVEWFARQVAHGNAMRPTVRQLSCDTFARIAIVGPVPP